MVLAMTPRATDGMYQLTWLSLELMFFHSFGSSSVKTRVPRRLSAIWWQLVPRWLAWLLLQSIHIVPERPSLMGGNNIDHFHQVHPIHISRRQTQYQSSSVRISS